MCVCVYMRVMFIKSHACTDICVKRAYTCVPLNFITHVPFNFTNCIFQFYHGYLSIFTWILQIFTTCTLQFYHMHLPILSRVPLDLTRVPFNPIFYFYFQNRMLVSYWILKDMSNWPHRNGSFLWYFLCSLIGKLSPKSQWISLRRQSSFYRSEL